MPDLNGWFLRRSVRRTESHARASLQKATALRDAALAAPSHQTALNALVALSEAAIDARAATKAVYRLIAREQQRVPGGVPDALTAGAWLPLRATQTISDQIVQAREGVIRDPTGQAALVYLSTVATMTQALESALTQTNKSFGEVQVARADSDQRQRQTRKLERSRRRYLAQYGGIDPQEVVEQVKSGRFAAAPAVFMLHQGEITLYATPAFLAEDKTTRQYVGASAGYSVPLGHGVRFRVGSYRGRTIAHERLTRVDQGMVTVTTQRIVYTGARRSLTIPVAKVLNTVLYFDGVDVRAENRAKREVFKCRNAKLLNAYILVACQLA